MRILSRLLFLFLIAAANPAMAAHYTFDKGHTRVLFSISHLGFSHMPGWMNELDGSFEFDEKNPEASTVNVTIYPRSVDMAHAGLNEHLKKADFFNIEKFPEITFKSTAVKVTGTNTGTLTGNLTLLGVTKPVTLNVTFNKMGKHPMTQEDVAGFSATGRLKRSDFGMTYGIPNVGDDVELRIEVEAFNRTPRVEEEKKAN